MKILLMIYIMMMLLMLFRRRKSRITKTPCWYDPKIRDKHLRDMIERSDTLCLEQIRIKFYVLWFEMSAV